MSCKLRHTAEAIDHKLDLITKNKNLLRYPYTTNLVDGRLPLGLEDVGDGSILTTDVTTPEREFVFTTCALTTGKKYTISLDITNIVDEVVTNSGFSLKVDIEGKEPITTDNFTVLDLSSEAVTSIPITISLSTPTAFDIGVVIKPQIEEGEEKTKWVPYMETIGTYVDERFNSTNAKIKLLTKNNVGESTPSLGETFNVYKDCTINGTELTATKAISTASHAEGAGTSAGTRCFKFRDYTYTENDKDADNTGWYYLTDVTGIEDLIVVDNYYPKYTVILEGNYDFQGEVIAVDTVKNAVKVTNYILPTHDEDSNTYTQLKDSSYFFLPEHADLGGHVAGTSAHAEGYETQALGLGSHAEGYSTIAAGKFSHAEGKQTKAAYASHSEGRLSEALGETSHAEGHGTKAYGDYSHSEGLCTIAAVRGQHAQGKYNIKDTENVYADIIGNGDKEATRSNAATVDWKGNAWYAGDVYVGGTHAYKKGNQLVTDATKLATAQEVNNLANQRYFAVDLTANTDSPLFKFETVKEKANTINVTITTQAFFSYKGAHTSISAGKSAEFTYGSSGNFKALLFNHNSYKLEVEIVNELSELGNRSILLFFNAQPSQLKRPANVSYKGTYEFDGVIYNQVPSSSEKALYKYDVTKYVSTTGKDTNTGNTSDKPYRTIQKAIDSGATIIHVATGEYTENISSTAIKHKLHIFGGWDGNGTCQRSKAVINCGQSLTFVTDDSGLSKASYSCKDGETGEVDTDNMMYKAFVSKEVDMTGDGVGFYESNRSNGYPVNLWKKDTIKDTKFTPVLTYDECFKTANTWYYDGDQEIIYVNSSAGEYILSSGNIDGIKLENIDDLVLEDIEVRYPRENGFAIKRCNNVKVTACGAINAGLRNGFFITYVNGIFEKCYSHRNRNDGYGIAQFGHTVFNDCEANYNYDDGVSHHDGCTGTVNGGKYVGNAKGGVAPAHGAVVDCYNVFCSDNKYGFYCVDTQSDDYGRAYTLNSCVAHNNSYNDILITNYHITAYNCSYDSVSHTSNATTSFDDRSSTSSSTCAGFVAQETEPENTDVLWIDTSSDGGLKYYDGTSWVTVPVRFS